MDLFDETTPAPHGAVITLPSFGGDPNVKPVSAIQTMMAGRLSFGDGRSVLACLYDDAMT